MVGEYGPRSDGVMLFQNKEYQELILMSTPQHTVWKRTTFDLQCHHKPHPPSLFHFIYNSFQTATEQCVKALVMTPSKELCSQAFQVIQV